MNGNRAVLAQYLLLWSTWLPLMVRAPARGLFSSPITIRPALLRDVPPAVLLGPGRCTVRRSVAREHRPALEKPGTFRSETVTFATGLFLSPTTRTPFPPSTQQIAPLVLGADFFSGGTITGRGPTPRSVSPEVLTVTLSRYVPACTKTVSPARAAFAAFWIDSTGCTVRVRGDAAAGRAPAPTPRSTATNAAYPTCLRSGVQVHITGRTGRVPAVSK